MRRSNPKTLLYIAAVAWLLMTCTGCPRGDAGNTVTVVLRGEPRLSAQIAEHLVPSLLDDAQWSSTSWTQWGRETKMTLAPVENPESLRERIGFGAVTRIDDRTVYVEVNRVVATLSVILARNREIFRDLFSADPDHFPHATP